MSPSHRPAPTPSDLGGDASRSLGEPRRSAREERLTKRRNEFLDAATKAIREQGAGISMEALARAGGVTKPILYRVFGDRDGLVRELANRWTNELLATLEAAFGTGLEPRDILLRGIDGFFELVERDPEIYRFLTERLAGAPDQPVSHVLDRTARRVARVLSEQPALSGMSDTHLVVWAYSLVGMAQLTADWWVVDRLISRTEVVGHVVDLAWGGMSAMFEPAAGGEQPDATG